MIPKIIHYCWFGNNPLSDDLKACIESWKKFCPDYKIIEWNESNYDITKIPYLSRAYAEEKWAFVSDYIRLDVVYQYGGIYLDTDVELLKSLDSLLENECFLGCEYLNDVATGLCFGAVASHWFIKENMSVYENNSFSDLHKTCVEITSDLLFEHGLANGRGIRQVKDITIYPSDFFNPINFWTGHLNISENTYSIHHGAGSWTKNSVIPMKYKIAVRLWIDKVFGHGTYRKLLRTLKLMK